MTRAGTTNKSARTKELIYATALKLFRTRGYDATTMRDIAGRARLSSGATYYHFRSKDEIVLEFYLRTQDELRAEAERQTARTKDFRARLAGLVVFQLELFEPRRKFLSVLYQNSVDPRSPLSPFGEATRAVREDSIAVFDLLLRGSNAPARGDLAPHLPYLVWLYTMGLLLFWIFDESPGRARTRRFLDLSLVILWQALKLQNLPFARRLLKSVLALLAEFNFLPAQDSFRTTVAR